MKDKDESPETDLNEIKMYDLLEREFKITIIKCSIRTTMHKLKEFNEKI